MKLNELLDNPLPYKVRGEGDYNFIATFKAGDRRIRFHAENEGGLDDEDIGLWTIVFGEQDKRSPEYETYRYDRTGGGNELQVFATLKKIIIEFMAKYHPKIVEFTADKTDGSRANLYDRMFKKSLPPGWKISRDHDPEVETFYLMKESLDKPLPYKITRDSSYFFDADFKAGNRLIRFEAQERGSISKSWEVSFYEIVPSKNGGEIEISKKTGNGNEFEIFATIKAIIDEFIQKRDPGRISIDSFKGEANRGRLYQRMLSKNAPAGWKLERDDKHPSYTTFHLVKTD